MVPTSQVKIGHNALALQVALPLHLLNALSVHLADNGRPLQGLVVARRQGRGRGVWIQLPLLMHSIVAILDTFSLEV